MTAVPAPARSPHHEHRARPRPARADDQGLLDVRALRLLLLDEPSSLIDHDARLGLQAEIERIHLEHGLTTFT